MTALGISLTVLGLLIVAFHNNTPYVVLLSYIGGFVYCLFLLGRLSSLLGHFKWLVDYYLFHSRKREIICPQPGPWPAGSPSDR